MKDEHAARTHGKGTCSGKAGAEAEYRRKTEPGERSVRSARAERPERADGPDRAEICRYLGGLKRYTEKGIPIYMDGLLSGPEEWERLFEVREDGMFYMGDYVQADAGGLKEIRFDPVYLEKEPEYRRRRRGAHGD